MSKTRGVDSVTPLPACGNGRGWGARPSAQQTGCANPKRANLHAPHDMVNWNGDIASGGTVAPTRRPPRDGRHRNQPCG